jgi:hypothetical protein
VSKKQKKTVPSVETKKPESVERAENMATTTPSSAADSGQPQEKAGSASSEPRFITINDLLAKVDPQKLQMAEDLGIPIGTLLAWAKGQKARAELLQSQIQIMGEAIQKGMPTEEGIAKKMMEQLKNEREKAIANAQAQQNTQNQPQAPQQQSGGSEIDILKRLLDEGGGGASNPVQEKMNKLTDAILDKAIEGVTNPKSSKFEEYFEEELAKAKAKTMAKALTTP